MTDDVSAKINEFFSKYRLRQYAKGQVLILGGEVTSMVYQLVSGQVKVYDVTYRGEEVVLNVFRPPAFFPMSMAINKEQPNPYVFEAETDIEIRQAPADEVVAFIKANPDVMFDLLSRLYKGLDGLMGRMSQLMSGSAKSRLMYELLIAARRFGKQQDDGCRIALSERDLGARAGLSRETVSREMHKLKADGLIEVRVGAVVIKDIGRLERLLGQEV